MEKKYIDGLYCKRPHEKAPQFVKGDIGINADSFCKWLQENKNEKGYVNLQILEGRDGSCYIKHNDYQGPKKMEAGKVETIGEINIEDLEDGDLIENVPF